MNNATIGSYKPADPEQNLRWLAWESKNRQIDRIAENRMRIFFVVVFVILLTLMVYALAHVRKQAGPVEKGPTVACRWNAGQLRY
jgi:heme/copper-type cytochrome/quinol oxidase subunit 2